jgi:hypothetical protein
MIWYSVVKKFILIASALLISWTVVLPAIAETLDTSKVFSSPIAGLGITKTTLLKKLGRPLKKSAPQDDDCNGFAYTRWTYPGFAVDVTTATASNNQSFVAAIEITSPKFATINGIRVGDSLSKVASLYAEKIMTNIDGSQYISVRNYEKGGILIFTAKDSDLVTSIYLGPHSALPQE